MSSSTTSTQREQATADYKQAGQRWTRLSQVSVVTPNFNTRFSGVTATVIALLPIQEKTLDIAAVGVNLPNRLPRIRLRDLFLHGWTPPAKHRWRIWHARRNNEMILGIILKYLLRQPWKLLFTSAAQRHHTWLTRFLIRRMDAVIATSPQSANFLRVPSTVIMHGVDTDRFHPAANRQNEWKQRGIAGRFGIGIFGRVRHQKGTDLFVEAMLATLPRYPDWTAVIIGLTEEKDIGFVKTLKTKIANAGLAERILFLGEQPVEDIPFWYRSLSIVAAPARWEGFGLVPLEAMASGTPIIASQAGAFPALVDTDKTGFLIPINDAPALASASEKIMAHPEKIEELGGAGRARVEAQFSIQREADAIGKIYLKLWSE